MKIINASLFFALILLLLCPLSVLAQEGEAEHASGTVYTLENGEPQALPMANVRWLGTTYGGTTDVNGQFSIVLMNRTNDLVISYTGYQNDTVSYLGKPLEIILQTGVALDGVDIISESESQAMYLLNPLNVQKLDGRELRKAACCNLSESFETNASIDASFTDAITGTRQIRMLGLSGRYSQILKDNIPNIRGLNTIYGLGYIPGDWIEDIHISKGAGSVSNGFESITGEINVAIKDADTEEKAHFNFYGNEGGRLELNSNVKWNVSEAWNTILLAHAELNQERTDRNSDGFMDNPIKEDFVLRNQWKFRGKKHWEGQYAINYVRQDQQSGQLDYKPEGIQELWGMHLKANRIEASAKTGYVFDDNWNSSMGSQFSYDRHDMNLSSGTHQFSGLQSTIRANVLYATKLGCMKKALTVGLSALNDDYQMNLDSMDLSRNEQVIGAYAEFTWNPNTRLSTIIGMRGDHHNLFGFMYSPRLHIRYSLTDDLSLKAAAGRGYRTVNPVTDNLGLLASNRTWDIDNTPIQESAWNAGVNLSYKFKLDYRDASLALDFYSTQFDEQAIIDFETPGQVKVYALSGESYAHTAQAEFGWEIMRRTDIRIAYRYTDAQSDYNKGLTENPFNPRHRGFVNLAFETKKNKNEAQWKFDATLQAIGTQRIPAMADLAEEVIVLSSTYSPSFFQAHGQITKVFKKGLEAYLGVENAGNYRQANPIQFASEPFSDSFDASQVWGPVFGRMSYAGLRWTLY